MNQRPWNRPRAGDELPEVRGFDLVRLEGGENTFLAVEKRLEEIGGEAWDGVWFRNRVLAALGWHPEWPVAENDRPRKTAAYAEARRMLSELGWKPTTLQTKRWLHEESDITLGIDVDRTLRDWLDAIFGSGR